MIPCRKSTSPLGPLVAVAALALASAPAAARAGSPDLLLPPGPAPPRLIHAPGGGRLAPPAEGSPEEIARSTADRWLRPAGEMALVRVVEGGGGVRFVQMEQRFDGVPVLGGRVTVAVGRDGAVLAIAAGELAGSAPERVAGRPLLGTAPEARARAARLTRGPSAPGLEAAAQPSAVEVLLPRRDGAVRAWRVRVLVPGPVPAARDLFLAAADGRLLLERGASFGAIETGRAYPRDPTRPSELVSFPHPIQNPTVHSPVGWETDGRTVGNNVVAYLERSASFTLEGPVATATGDPLSLDFAFTGDPRTDADAAMANVFWVLNDAHDRFRALGFDEASGAAQVDDFGRGGEEGDPVWALVQFASRDGTVPTGQINTGVAADGSFTWMTVGVFQVPGTGELRDGAFERDLLVHEYAHVVSTRLLGGEPSCWSGAQPAAIAEGFGDFFAASFTGDPVIGAWVSGDPDTGLRQAALDRNPFSLLQLCADGCNPQRDGEIVSGILWDVRERLQSALGPESGVVAAERLALEALRYVPCRPTLVDLRDGMLLADVALDGGAHHCLIWAAFRDRGVGASTQTSGPDDRFPLAGFDDPPQCSGGSAVELDREEYGLLDEALVWVVDAAPPPGATVTVRVTGGGEVVLPLEPSGPSLATARVTLVEGAAGPGELEVAAGQELTAEYPGAETARALVTDGIAIEISRHAIWASWCQRDADDDHDDTPGWWNLPGFLDAGENADVYVTAANLTGADLVDAAVTVRSATSSVRTLPTAPLPLGRIPAARGRPTPFAFAFKAAALPDVLPGEQAEILFEFTARGRRGTASLPLTLDMDYVVVEGLSPFAGGVETFEADSPTAPLWTHEATRPVGRPGPDDWGLQTCDGRRGMANAGAGCSSYSDEQGTPVLLSPQLFDGLPADAVAFRMTDYGWSNHVDLWTDPANRYCDADEVAVFLTADPASLPLDEPLSVFELNPERVYLFTDNTDGHAPSGPYFVDTNPQDFQPGIPYDQLRLAWILWSDVIDCGFETANEGRYLLDDVRFRYDVVRAVPETTPCSADCALRLELAASPPGPKCPGEPFVLTTEGTEVDGCAGQVYFSFAGPGVPAEAGWTTDRSAPAVGEDAGVYAVYAQCDTDPQCDHYRSFSNEDPSLPGVGTTLPGSLRVTREDAGARLRWLGAAAPPSYGAWGAGLADDLAAPETWRPLGDVLGEEGLEGQGELLVPLSTLGPGTVYLKVLGRDPCSGAPRLP